MINLLHPISLNEEYPEMDLQEPPRFLPRLFPISSERSLIIASAISITPFIQKTVDLGVYQTITKLLNIELTEKDGYGEIIARSSDFYLDFDQILKENLSYPFYLATIPLIPIVRSLLHSVLFDTCTQFKNFLMEEGCSLLNEADKRTALLEYLSIKVSSIFEKCPSKHLESLSEIDFGTSSEKELKNVASYLTRNLITHFYPKPKSQVPELLAKWQTAIAIQLKDPDLNPILRTSYQLLDQILTLFSQYVIYPLRCLNHQGMLLITTQCKSLIHLILEESIKGLFNSIDESKGFDAVLQESINDSIENHLDKSRSKKDAEVKSEPITVSILSEKETTQLHALYLKIMSYITSIPIAEGALARLSTHFIDQSVKSSTDSLYPVVEQLYQDQLTTQTIDLLITKLFEGFTKGVCSVGKKSEILIPAEEALKEQNDRFTDLLTTTLELSAKTQLESSPTDPKESFPSTLYRQTKNFIWGAAARTSDHIVSVVAGEPKGAVACFTKNYLIPKILNTKRLLLAPHQLKPLTLKVLPEFGFHIDFTKASS